MFSFREFIHSFFTDFEIGKSPHPKKRVLVIIVSRVAVVPAKRKFRSGMRFLPNAAGEMRRAPTCKRPRSDHTGAIATIFRLGWICMTSKKAEHRGDDFVPLGIGPYRSFTTRALAVTLGLLTMIALPG